MKTIVTSFRVKPSELAKALDGLIANSEDHMQFTNLSQIVRTTFYHGIVALCANPSGPPSKAAMEKITQILNQNKTTKNVNLNDILKA